MLKLIKWWEGNEIPCSRFIIVLNFLMHSVLVLHSFSVSSNTWRDLALVINCANDSCHCMQIPVISYVLKLKMQMGQRKNSEKGGNWNINRISVQVFNVALVSVASKFRTVKHEISFHLFQKSHNIFKRTKITLVATGIYHTLVCS